MTHTRFEDAQAKVRLYTGAVGKTHRKLHKAGQRQQWVAVAWTSYCYGQLTTTVKGQSKCVYLSAIRLRLKTEQRVPMTN